MRRPHSILVIAAALLAAAMLCGCERTAEGTSADNVSANASCPQGTQQGDQLCSAAGEDCAGCPAMEGAEVVKSDAETHECPGVADGKECPEGCTCVKVEAADGTLVCAHGAECPAAKDGSCPHAAKVGDTGGESVKTSETTCPKACGASSTCPRSGEAS